MYGVIMEKAPQDWQILQQVKGYAEVTLAGRIEAEEEVLAHEDLMVAVYAVEENSNIKVTPPVMVKPEKNRWSAVLRIPSGGLYRLESCLRFHGVWEKRGDTRFHIGVGDVYVIAGQSNAVGTSKDAAEDEMSLDVHMLRQNGRWDIAAHPLHDDTGTMFSAIENKGPRAGCGPWICFARTLARHLGYPIGLLPCALGGTELALWNRQEDGRLFRNMLDMVKASGGGIKGILWYQGCHDTVTETRSSTYFERFREVCSDFERSFYAKIPILSVQLNKMISVAKADAEQVGRGFGRVREAQRRAMREIKNVYMVPSIDLKLWDGIHNTSASSLIIGERVAYAALKHVYGKEGVCDAPDLQRAMLESEKTVVLYFDHVYDSIYTDVLATDKLMFSLQDEQGQIFPTSHECPGGNRLCLSFARPIAEKATISCDRYTDTGLMPYDIFSGLPVIPFSGVAVESTG